RQPAGALAHAVVQREEGGGDLPGDGGPLGGDALELGVDRRPLRVPGLGVARDVGGDRGLLRLELREPALGLLEPLHDLELDLLEVALPLGELGELGLQGLGLLGAHGTGVEASLVPGGPLTDLLDVALRLGHLAAGVTDDGPLLDLCAADVLQPALELGDRLEHGQAAALVAQPRGARVECLDVEQAALVGHRGCGHWATPSLSVVLSLSGAPRRSVHGSVTILLTSVESSAPAARASSSSRA